MDEATLLRLEKAVVLRPGEFDRRRVYADALEEMDLTVEAARQRQIVERKLSYFLPLPPNKSVASLGQPQRSFMLDEAWCLELTKAGLLFLYNSESDQVWPTRCRVDGRVIEYEELHSISFSLNRNVNVRELAWRIRRGDASIMLATCQSLSFERAGDYTTTGDLFEPGNDDEEYDTSAAYNDDGSVVECFSSSSGDFIDPMQGLAHEAMLTWLDDLPQVGMIKKPKSKRR